MDAPQIGVAFAAGVLSFLSPCVLAVAPGYLSILTGDIGDRGMDRRRALWTTLAFIVGFSLVFIAMGATVSMVGQFFRAYRAVFARVLGLIVIFFALHQLGWLRWFWLYREKRFKASRVKGGPFKPFLTGMAFAFGWSPCVGPILGMILALAGNSGQASSGLGLLAVYSLGLALPFIGLALAYSAFRRFSSFILRHSRWVEMISGLLLLVMGLLLFFDGLTIISRWFNQIFQGWSPEQWIGK